MKYDLVVMINKYLESKGLRKLNSNETKAVRALASSTYPEFDGLRVIDDPITESCQDHFIKILLTNKNCERKFSLNLFNDFMEVKEDVDFRNRFYLKYDLNKDKVDELVYTSEDDIIRYVYGETRGFVSFYVNASNAANVKKDNATPVELIPDYSVRFVCNNDDYKVNPNDNYISDFRFENLFYLKSNGYNNKFIKARMICEMIKDRYYQSYPHFNKTMIYKKK